MIGKDLILQIMSQDEIKLDDILSMPVMVDWYGQTYIVEKTVIAKDRHLILIKIEGDAN